MNIEFDNTALEELYTNGKTQDHKYKRLPMDVVKQYIKVVNYIKAVNRLEDLSKSSRSTTRKRKATSMVSMQYG